MKLLLLVFSANSQHSLKGKMVRPEGFEPSTVGLEVRRLPLQYKELCSSGTKLGHNIAFRAERKWDLVCSHQASLVLFIRNAINHAPRSYATIVSG